jgi:HK97 family phage portal protein
MGAGPSVRDSRDWLRGSETILGIFDWLGPTSLTKRRGWDTLPAVQSEAKLYALQDFGAAITVRTLVHGPGATELLAGPRASSTNSAVVACLAAITTAYPEAPLKVFKIKPDERTALPDHALTRFLTMPNPFLPLEALLSYVQWCKRVDGNAYLRKIRSGNDITGNVVQLWPITPTRIEPRTIKDSGDFISFYRYYLAPGKYEDIAPENVVHFRLGLDDRDHRVGCSPLKSLFREVSTDERASAFSDTLLANFAVPGLSATYPADATPLTQAQADEVKARIRAAYSGDNVGDVAVLVGGMKLDQHGWSPEQLDLKGLHRLPEERISAVLQVPAIVAGLGAGLDRSTFSNVREAREMFTEMNLVPSWRADAAVLNAQLKPDFVSDPTIRLEFDLDEVRALQDDQNAKATRIDTLVRGGQLTINEGRAEMGFDAIDGGDVLMLPGAWAPTPPSHLAALAAAPAPDPSATPPSGGSSARPVITTLPNEPPALPPGKTRTDLETKALSDDEIVARYESGLASLTDTLAADLFDAFEVIAEAASARIPTGTTNGKAHAFHAVALLELKAEALPGLVTEADHAEIRSLLRSAVLKGMRSAADGLAPLTGDKPVRITRNMPAVKAAVAEMEKRLPGIIETTGEDFGRLVRRLERRPGSVPLADVQQALLDYVAETYPGRSAAIARTELGYAHAKGVLLVVEKAGLGSKVHVHDGDGDAACRARNGEVLTTEAAAGVGLLHTNCQLRLIPVIGAS